MNPQKSLDLKEDLKSFQRDVMTFRDEVRLKLHLAGMDLKTEWEALEPQLDKVFNNAATASTEVISDLKKRLEEFKHRLGRN